MGMFNKFFDKMSENKKLENLEVKTPKDLFVDILRGVSGASVARELSYNIFYQIVGFQGATNSVGTSTLVANTALALAKLDLSVCVIDTSILAPAQFTLLGCEDTKKVDLFDLPYTKENIIYASKYSSKIGLVCFRNRTLVDLLSSNDDEDLVTLVLSEIHTKFDVVLVDICHETTSIVSACIQQSQKIIQVWSNAPQCMNNINGFINTNIMLSCPLDKMRYVVANLISDDIETDWDNVLNQFKFIMLAKVGISKDIQRVTATGKLHFDFVSESEDIQEINDCIYAIVIHILGIKEEADNNIDKLEADADEADNLDNMVAEASNQGTFDSEGTSQEDSSC